MRRVLFERYSKRAWLFIGAGLVVICLLGGGAYAAFGGFAGPATGNTVDLQKNLVGWWKLEGNAKDSSPSGANGSVIGTPTSTTDKEGKAGAAYLFNTSADKVQIPDSASIDPTSQITLAARIRMNTMNTRVERIIDKLNGNGYTLYETSDSPSDTCGSYNFCWKVSVSGSARVISTPLNTLTPGNWYDIAGTYDGTTTRLYINGNQVASGSFSGVVSSGTAPLCFGVSANASNCTSTNPFTGGVIDDVRLYSRALSAAEVTALTKVYDPGIRAGNGENGLVGWWKLDGNLKDSTPYARNAVMKFGHTPVYTADRKGSANSAQSFNGADDCDDVSGNLFAGSSDFTLSVWVQNTALNDGNLYNIMGYYNVAGPTPPGLEQRNSGGVLRVGLYDSGGSYQSVDFSNYFTGANTGQWTHIVATKSGTTVSVYRNGSFFGSATVPSASIYTMNNYSIGCIGNYWKGKLDDVRIYNRALSASEITSQYDSYNSQINLNSSPSTTTTAGNINQGLVGYWPFNGNAKDYTPYGNNGTISGATLTTDRKGRANSAYQFGSTNQYINVGNPATYSNLTSTGFTYSVWLIRTGNSTFQWPQIMGSADTHVGYGIRSQKFGDYISFEYGVSPYNGANGNFSNIGGTNNLPINQWHLFTFTYSGTTLKYYLDGALAFTQTSVVLNPTFTGMTFTNSTNGFSGSMDDARVYNRALSATEVQTLYYTQN